MLLPVGYGNAHSPIHQRSQPRPISLSHSLPLNLPVGGLQSSGGVYPAQGSESTVRLR